MTEKNDNQFKQGYDLGFKHGKEYYLANNRENANKKTSLKDVFGDRLTTLDFDTATKQINEDNRKQIFGALLSGESTIKTTDCFNPEFTISNLQAKFVKYYLKKSKTTNIIPVLQMRQGGMTSILEEIAYREYLSGKKVLYCNPNGSLTKITRGIIDYKQSVNPYMRIVGGAIDYKTERWEDCSTKFPSEILGTNYDLIIIDTIPYNADLCIVNDEISNYIASTGGKCRAIITTDGNCSPRSKKQFEKWEEDGGLYRYVEVTDSIAEHLMISAKFNDIEMFKRILKESLGLF